jgi:hypothetical protein
METQNRTQRAASEGDSDVEGGGGYGNWHKFPEPRAWALNWETQNPDELANRANGRFDSEQVLKSSGDKFPQPRGWALKWDGDSITAPQVDGDNDVLPPDVQTRTDEA